MHSLRHEQQISTLWAIMLSDFSIWFDNWNQKDKSIMLIGEFCNWDNCVYLPSSCYTEEIKLFFLLSTLVELKICSMNYFFHFKVGFSLIPTCRLYRETITQECSDSTCCFAPFQQPHLSFFSWSPYFVRFLFSEKRKETCCISEVPICTELHSSHPQTSCLRTHTRAFVSFGNSVLPIMSGR
jgi:hypothetical protein